MSFPVKIKSYKKDGSFHRMWEENIILFKNETKIITGNYATKVIESDGSIQITKQPAIAYFYKKYYFNVIAIFDQSKVSFYCNLSSPYKYEEKVLSYIDYDLDIIVSSDFEYNVIDTEEYLLHKETMNYSNCLHYRLMKEMNLLKNWIKKRKGPFSLSENEIYYKRLKHFY